jgi:hypothetical protein
MLLVSPRLVLVIFQDLCPRPFWEDPRNDTDLQEVFAVLFTNESGIFVCIQAVLHYNAWQAFKQPARFNVFAFRMFVYSSVMGRQSRTASQGPV